MILESFGLLILIVGTSGFVAWFMCRHLPKKILVPSLLLLVIAVPTTSIILLENNIMLLGYLMWTIGGGATIGIGLAIDRFLRPSKKPEQSQEYNGKI